jgi:hypothetical protein
MNRKSPAAMPGFLIQAQAQATRIFDRAHIFHTSLFRGAVQERQRLAERPSLPGQSKTIMLIVKS